MTSRLQKSATWYLYIIRCNNGHLYTGITTNVARRFSEHKANSSKTAKYLKGKQPLTLVYQEMVGCHGDALRRELAIKQLSRVNKLKLIASHTEMIRGNDA